MATGVRRRKKSGGKARTGDGGGSKGVIAFMLPATLIYAVRDLANRRDCWPNRIAEEALRRYVDEARRGASA